MSHRLSRPAFAAVSAAFLFIAGGVLAEEAPKGAASGTVLADSGFRPKPNGFGFENWGGDQYPVSDLTGDEAALLFGDRVCARFEGESCVPTAAAKLWLAEMNQMMQGGHCEGMAALSAAFHVKEESIGDYGAKQPFELAPRDADLMRTISTYFVTQALEPVQSTAATARNLTLQQIVERLVKSLQPGGDYMTLGIYGADGGHAVTPYKVEASRAGNYRVYVYDNNYPGAEKFIDIDVPNDRWVYAGAALNPREDPAPWEGGSGTMDLTPLSVRYEALECPFCGEHQAPARPKAPSGPEKPRKPSVASSDYIVFTPARCSQLQATRKADKKQLTAGKNGVKNELGKASMTAFRGARGCAVRLPKDQRYDLAIIDDGRPAYRPNVGLIVVGAGSVYSVSNIALSPSTTQRITFDGDAFAFQAGGVQKPTIRIAGDSAGSNTVYEVTGFTLSDGRTFGAKEDASGRITFHDDDPALDACDISLEEISLDGTENFELDDLNLGDNGQVTLDIDDEGRLDVDLDSDSDGTADDVDTDDDNDGQLDAQDTDDDNDGVADNSEALDSDGDSIPDAEDSDDDNDGAVDAADKDGLNIDADEVDSDHDGTVDAADADDDNDGEPDTSDPDEIDTDHDGTVDSADSDDDNDGTVDSADSDDNNDGVSDESEGAAADAGSDDSADAPIDGDNDEVGGTDEGTTGIDDNSDTAADDAGADDADGADNSDAADTANDDENPAD